MQHLHSAFVVAFLIVIVSPQVTPQEELVTGRFYEEWGDAAPIIYARDIPPSTTQIVQSGTPSGQGLGSVKWVARDEWSFMDSLALASSDGTAFVAWLANNPRFSAYDVGGSDEPLWSVIPPVRARGGSAAAGNTAESLFSTYVDFLVSPILVDSYSSEGIVEWRTDISGSSGSAIPFIDADRSGNHLSFVVPDASSRTIGVLNAESGETIWRLTRPTYFGRGGVDISADGSTVMTSTSNAAYIFAGLTGSQLASLPGKECCHGGWSISAPGLSDDGQRAVAWQGGNVTLYERSGDTYAAKWTANTGRQAIRTATISGNGEVIMVGAHNWVAASPGPGVTCDRERLLLYRANSQNTLWSYDLYGGKFACISDIAITPDGTRAAAVSWGSGEQEANANDLVHDVLTVFDTRGPLPVPLFRLLDDIDETGTLWDVAISDDGKYVIAGGSARHISGLMYGGVVYSIEMLV